MNKKVIIVAICLALLVSTIPKDSWGLVVDPDIGTDNPTIDSYGSGSGPCTGPWWTKIACVAGKVASYMRTIQKITKALDYTPHSFPFGGPILSSERACGFHFRLTTWVGVNVFGVWAPIPAPVPVTIPLAGRAIRVGEPGPVVPPTTFPYGRVIAFPWISNIYRNHTENRAGPWALGLGFTPFPLKDINDSLGDIRIWIPPTPIDRNCLIPDPSWYGRVGWLAECIDQIRFDCLNSGEKDASGVDIYKVIRKLGTSKDNAPATAFPPGFTLP